MEWDRRAQLTFDKMCGHVQGWTCRIVERSGLLLGQGRRSRGFGSLLRTLLLEV